MDNKSQISDKTEKQYDYSAGGNSILSKSQGKENFRKVEI